MAEFTLRRPLLIAHVLLLPARLFGRFVLHSVVRKWGHDQRDAGGQTRLIQPLRERWVGRMAGLVGCLVDKTVGYLGGTLLGWLDAWLVGCGTGVSVAGVTYLNVNVKFTRIIVRL